MQDDCYTATTFQRHNRPLRGVLIDDQPWFVAHDLACLLGVRFPQTLAQRVEEYEVQTVRLLSASGGELLEDVINEAALYKVLIRFGHPESRTLGCWLSEQVIPPMRGQVKDDAQRPRRITMRWESLRMTVLDWQGGKSGCPSSKCRPSARSRAARAGWGGSGAARRATRAASDGSLPPEMKKPRECGAFSTSGVD
ncbi:BRO family protein [Pseudomonas sp. SCB32]|uniref:BRO-N domain-containing protein n=1 Tax=Pseudomonas sp. SCB32 TaxID=2653853 RepID=UPI0021148302|nr:BRO family protein [Pseudomonas sp. SCB32]